jgi:hypothetical protein
LQEGLIEGQLIDKKEIVKRLLSKKFGLNKVEARRIDGREILLKKLA